MTEAVATEILISRFLEGLNTASVATSALAQFQQNPSWIGVRTAIDMTKDIVVEEVVNPYTAAVKSQLILES
jgi:hypothetical protein